MRKSVVLLAIVGALYARDVAAQPAPWEPERLTAGWVVTPSMVLGILHDSNVTLRSASEQVHPEWVGLINPRGELDFNGRHTHFNLGYSGGYEAYRQFSELNRYEQRARLELRHQPQAHLNLYTHASYSSVPTTDRLDLGPGLLPFVSIGSQHASGAGGAQYALSPRTHLTGNFSFQAIKFDRELPTDPEPVSRFLRDGHSWSPSIGVMHEVSQHVSLGGSWDYNHSVIDSGLQVYTVQNLTAETAWQSGEHTTVRAGAGVSHLRSRTDLVDRWGPAYHAGLDHNEGRVEMSANYERSFVPSIGFGGLNANQRFSGGVHLPVTKGGRTVVGGSVSWGRIEPVDLLGVSYTLNSLWTQGTVGYQISRWLRTEGFINHSHQTSTARGLVDRTRIGIQFVTAKPVRIQ